MRDGPCDWLNQREESECWMACLAEASGRVGCLPQALAQSCRSAPLLTVEQKPSPPAPHRSLKGFGSGRGRSSGDGGSGAGEGGGSGEGGESRRDDPELVGAGSGEAEAAEGGTEEEGDWEMI